MDRTIARWLASLAIREKCSLICMPGTLVWIGLKSPRLGCPGLGSKVSIWLGPPLIQSRMQERLRCGSMAAAVAKAPSQPDCEKLAMQVAPHFSQSRRERLETRGE